MKVRISTATKRILLDVNMENYCRLVNEISRLEIPQSMLMIENENRAIHEVEKLIKKYFPNVLENYNMFLTLEDSSFEDPKYFLTLRKKERLYR
jgi:DNA-binding protein H-NS